MDRRTPAVVPPAPPPAAPPARAGFIRIRGAREHTLKNLTLDIPREKLVVITGLSGSGKSSLAFDTIYAEGQRRYVESLSAYARQFLEQLEKPDVDYVEGLPPTIAIEQKQTSPNPRSTVATTTEIHDYLRLLFARCGTALCPGCGSPLKQSTRDMVVDELMRLPENRRFLLLAPVALPVPVPETPENSSKKTDQKKDVDPWKHLFDRLRADGFVRARVDGVVKELSGEIALDEATPHRVEVVVDRLVAKPDMRTRVAESLETALRTGEGLAIASVESPHINGNGRLEPKFTDHFVSDRYACARCRTTFPELEPRLFSFNSPEGACPACDGLGTRAELDPELIVPDPDMTLSAGAVEAWKRGGKKLTGYYDRLLADFCDRFGVKADVPYRNLSVDARRILMYGTRPTDAEVFDHFFEGVIPNLLSRYEKTESPQVKSRIHGYMSEQPCPTCDGSRLRKEALAVRLPGDPPERVRARRVPRPPTLEEQAPDPLEGKGGVTIADATRMTVGEAHVFFGQLALKGEAETVAQRILKGIRDRLHFLVEVGVHYLTLDRSSSTLSGGEAQRIRLATQVGSGLVGICYVLDEPTIGLHQRDNARLLETLIRLRDMGNSVIVVEHDEQTIRLADYVIDMGPGAGVHGGEIVAKGTLDEVLANPQSLTASYLRGELEVSANHKRRKVGKRAVEVKGARQNNLKNIDARFPLGGIVCVTGVSGSGKSTLVRDVLFKALARRTSHAMGKAGAHDRIMGAALVERVIEIDQSPIGRTPRSNPATFAGVMGPIRRLFASLNESAIRGYDQSRFSFNVKGGRCEACQGQGEKRIEMHFLPDVFVKCEQCKGRKYNREILEIKWKGLSIADCLDMTVEAARRFFKAFPRVKEPLKTLEDVGLGYLTLGQSSTTLSGGEAQRLKLGAELVRGGTGEALYVLDEPTTGLHFADISRLMDVLDQLADVGNTLVIVEHNLDVIRAADWVIDLGPEGGEGGGRIVCEGTPEDVAKHPTSHTGRFLREAMARAAASAPAREAAG